MPSLQAGVPSSKAAFSTRGLTISLTGTEILGPLGPPNWKSKVAVAVSMLQFTKEERPRVTPPICLTKMSATEVGRTIREVPESRMARWVVVSMLVDLEPSVRVREESSTVMASISVSPAWGTRGVEMRGGVYLAESTPPKRMVPDGASRIGNGRLACFLREESSWVNGREGGSLGSLRYKLYPIVSMVPAVFIDCRMPLY